MSETGHNHHGFALHVPWAVWLSIAAFLLIGLFFPGESVPAVFAIAVVLGQVLLQDFIHYLGWEKAAHLELLYPALVVYAYFGHLTWVLILGSLGSYWNKYTFPVEFDPLNIIKDGVARILIPVMIIPSFWETMTLAQFGIIAVILYNAVWPIVNTPLEHGHFQVWELHVHMANMVVWVTAFFVLGLTA